MALPARAHGALIGLALLLLALPACQGSRNYYGTAGPPAPAETTAAQTTSKPAGTTAPIKRPPGSARLTILGNGGPRGYVGDVMHKVRLVSLNGVPYTSRSPRLRIAAGPHTVVLRWTEYEIPEWVAYRTSTDQQTAAWQRTDGGERTLRFTAEAGKRYEILWPAYEESGPPLKIIEARD